MVFAVVLCHGRYMKEFPGTIQVPDNIRLVLYTNPRVELNETEAKYVYKQVILRNKKIAPSVLELENDATRTLDVFPFPIIKVLRTFNIGTRTFTKGERNYPRGEFNVYQPHERTQNFGIQFGADFRVFCLLQNGDDTLNILDSPSLGSNPLIQHIQEFCTRKDVATGKYSYNSIGEFLHLVSRYYTEEYPGRIITLMLLSCRAGEYDTVEELTQDVKALYLKKSKAIGYVRGPPSARISHEHVYDPNPGPDAYTRGIFINKLVLSKYDAVVEEPLNVGLYGGRSRTLLRSFSSRSLSKRHRKRKTRRKYKK